ncbi:MAG: hypothetical protein ABI550_09575, partial [Ignavibacteriaceae bacterium]
EKCTRMVREGISKGAVRKDLDENVIMFMYVTSVQNILVPEVLSEIPLTTEQVFENIISILFKGVFTEEGRIKYQKFLEDDEKEKQNFNSSLNSN